MNRKIETRDITVEQDQSAVSLTTVTLVQSTERQVFPSKEKALQNRAHGLMKEGAKGLFLGGLALGVFQQGINYITDESLVINGEAEKISLGIELIALGIILSSLAWRSKKNIGVIWDQFGKLSEKVVRTVRNENPNSPQ